jgi:hypothetical protein
MSIAKLQDFKNWLIAIADSETDEEYQAILQYFITQVDEEINYAEKNSN